MEVRVVSQRKAAPSGSGVASAKAPSRQTTSSPPAEMQPARAGGRSLSDPRTLVKLQRLAGNAAVSQLVASFATDRRGLTPGTPGRPVQRSVTAALFDMNDVAHQLDLALQVHDAMAVYRILQRFQGDADSATQLSEAFFGSTGRWPAVEIQAQLPPAQANHALRLLNLGGATPVAPQPSTPQEFTAMATAVKAAIDSGSPEAIFDALGPLQRSSGRAVVLAQSYQQAFSSGMRSDLAAHLSGQQLANAQYLLGDEVNEIGTVSEADAERIFDALAGLTFTTSAGQQSPVPYHYPVDGCYARAHLMAETLTRAGFASQKVFATSTTQGLAVRSDYSEDQPGTQPVTRWFYHVAPIIRCRTASGQTVDMVIDPSTQSGPVTISAWLAAMSPTSFQRLTHQELMAHLAEARSRGGPNTEGFPAGEQLTWTTDRNTMYPTEGPASDSRRADQDMANVRDRMTNYANLAPLHELAAGLRRDLAQPGCTVETIAAEFAARTSTLRIVFPGLFPQLWQQIVSRFGVAAVPAILGQAAVGSGP